MKSLVDSKYCKVSRMSNRYIVTESIMIPLITKLFGAGITVYEYKEQ